MLLTRLPPAPKCHDSPKKRMVSFEDCRAYGQQCRDAALDEAAELLLNAGFRSTGIPAYEALAERVRKLK